MNPEPNRWFDEAAFGLFVHFGLYAIPARGEWAIYRERIPRSTYRRYAARFRPDRFDADAWCTQAVRAGMRYLVLTAKHHDGFCLWPSRTTDFHVGNTPCGRDLVGEVVAACRRAGLRVGIYFSVWDLDQPGLDGGLGTAIGPDGEPVTGTADQAWRPSSDGVALMHAQVEELMSGYGPIDVLWFDVRRAPGTAYDADRLMRRIRSLQPGILINDRLVDAECAERADIVTPENRIPETPPVDAAGQPLRWEACMCLNQNWGYVRDDHEFKDVGQVLRELIEIRAKGGNLLLNVGPNARGEFPRPYAEVLDGVGAWLERQGESVRPAGPPGLTVRGAATWNRFFTDCFRWRCAYTRSGDRLYLHVLRHPADRQVVVPVFDGHRVEQAYLLDDASEIRFVRTNYYSQTPDECTLELPLHPGEHGITSIVLELRC